MARSKFRLESLLKIRRLEEDRAKRVVADRLRQIQRIEQRIVSLQGQLVEAGQVMRSLVLAGSIVPLEATRQRGYMGRLLQRLLETQMELRQLQAQLVQERAALAEASKRCKILDKLKQRQEQRRIRLENLAEQRASDEMGVLRFAHAMLAAGDAADESPEAAAAGT
jgi:flagellar protein FliJ